MTTKIVNIQDLLNSDNQEDLAKHLGISVEELDDLISNVFSMDFPAPDNFDDENGSFTPILDTCGPRYGSCGGSYGCGGYNSGCGGGC